MNLASQESLPHGLHLLELENYETTFAQALQELEATKGEWTFSHKIKGRWENTYVPIRSVPATKEILNLATNAANRTFGKRLVCCQGLENFIKDAFWFNIMGKGESTGWHNHNAKAHVSGVCYLDVPPDSGRFKYRDPEGNVHLHTPQTGTILLFPSSLNHAVETSQNEQPRISLAFNFFTLPLQLDPHEDPFAGNPFL